MRLWLKMKIISTYGSQVKFARACGKTDDWISRIITGRRNPNSKERELIVSKLGVNYEEELFLEQS